MAEPLRLHKARRRTLDPERLRDPLGGDPDEAAPERPRRAPRRAPANGGPPRSAEAETSSTPKRGGGGGRGAKPPRSAPGTQEVGDAALAMALAPKAQVGVMFEAEVWEGLTAIVNELRDQRKVRASRNALLIALLVRGLPVDERAALDLVGRYDLELSDRHITARRKQHTVRLPEPLIEGLDRLGESVRAAGFEGGRSALINAIVALRGAADAEAGAALLQAARRARAAAVIQAA